MLEYVGDIVHRFYYIFSIVLIFFQMSCQKVNNVGNLIDLQLFQKFGWTMFSKPGLVTMKEIHLDKGVLAGQVIAIEGDVVELGKYRTHLVVSDNTARMLVVLTDVYEALDLSDDILGQKIKIVGTVEDGKKGLPFVMAKSFNITKSNQSDFSDNL